MKKTWRRWLSGLIAAILVITNVPVHTYAQMEADESGKPTSFMTSDGEEVQVEESWEEVYPYGAFLFSNSDVSLAEGGEEISIPLYRLGGNSGRATAYVMYAPAVMQLTEEITSYGSAAGLDEVELAVEDPLPIAKYQPIGKEPDPEPSAAKILEKAAVGDEVEQDDRVLYLSESAETYAWQVLSEEVWESAEGATDVELVVPKELLEEYDFRCVFTKDGQSFCSDSLKGETYVRPEEEVLPDMPADLDLSPEKTFTKVEMDPENPYALRILPVTFADGEWVKEIRVKAPDNDKAQPQRFGTFTIFEHNGGTVFEAAATLTLSVTDNDTDAPYTIGFVETEVTADKSEGTAVVKLRREGGGQDPVTVDYRTVDGTAAAGKDFEGVSGTAVFYADINEVTIEIPLILDAKESEEPLNFTVALGELKGDSKGLCTLMDEEALVHLTNAVAQGTESPIKIEETLEDEEKEDEEASQEVLANEMTAGSSEDANAELPENALPYGGLADAFRAGTQDFGKEPITGEQVVASEDELSYGKISGLAGMQSGGGLLRSFNFGEINFEKAHGGNYWEDDVHIAGSSRNALTNWNGGSAYGNGWQLSSCKDASATLNISNMSKLYSEFYGYFEFNAGLDNGWHWESGYAYGWAGITEDGDDGTECEAQDGCTHLAARKLSGRSWQRNADFARR